MVEREPKVLWDNRFEGKLVPGAILGREGRDVNIKGAPLHRNARPNSNHL